MLHKKSNIVSQWKPTLLDILWGWKPEYKNILEFVKLGFHCKQISTQSSTNLTRFFKVNHLCWCWINWTQIPDIIFWLTGGFRSLPLSQVMIKIFLYSNIHWPPTIKKLSEYHLSIYKCFTLLEWYLYEHENFLRIIFSVTCKYKDKKFNCIFFILHTQIVNAG